MIHKEIFVDTYVHRTISLANRNVIRILYITTKYLYFCWFYFVDFLTFSIPNYINKLVVCHLNLYVGKERIHCFLVARPVTMFLDFMYVGDN